MLAVMLLALSFLGSEPVDLLPDLELLPDYLAITRVDTTTLPGRTLLRFSSAAANAGLGRLELRGGEQTGPTSRLVYQRIYRSDGSFYDRLAGTFTYHPTHSHFHVDGWTAQRVRRIDETGGPGEVVAVGEKISFCVLDSLVADPENPAFVTPPVYRSCLPSLQGLSPGYADIYDLNLPDQWVDVTDVPPGFYWLEAELDPDGHFLEEDETNNTVRVRIWIGPPPPALPDRFEENDSIAEVAARTEGAENSPNLGLVNARRVIDDLSMEDGADYFRLRFDTVGDVGGFIAIETDYLDNDLDLYLLDSTGLTLVVESTTQSSLDHISLEGVPPGDYILLVQPFSGTNPRYRLVIDPAASAPPAIEVIHPGAEGAWVEQDVEALAVEWFATDSEGDPLTVTLLADRDGVIDKGTMPIGGYDALPGAPGFASVNTVGLELGAWFLRANVTDGASTGGAWAPGPFVVYVKGDVDFDGHVTKADLKAIKKLYSAKKFPLGWRSIADMDRDGDVDKIDLAEIKELVKAGEAHAH